MLNTKPSEPDLRTPELKHNRHRDGELQPRPLSKPLGLSRPPRPGENSPLDNRSISDRWADHASYEKHLARRKAILQDIFERNYYKDIGNLGKLHRGKSILAPSTPFRANVALYFPNLVGLTLKSAWEGRDTTPVVRNRVTIVNVVNTEWANAQVQTFTSEKANPALHAFLRSDEARTAGAQIMTINVEPNWIKHLLIRMFFWRLRRQLPKEQHESYFLLRHSIPEEVRDALGIWNSKVGYVYLLDGQARVRWAGNGDARDDEKESLVNCVRRLCDEARGLQKRQVKREEPRRTKSLGQAAAVA